MHERTWTQDSLSGFTVLVSQPPAEVPAKARSLVILLHGVGSNERDLPPVGARIAPQSILLSVRAPLPLGPDAFGWFSVQFGPTGPIHNRPEAKESLDRLNVFVVEAAQRYEVPLSRVFLFGFSQGAIMTLGLALDGTHTLGGYIACSGRILPEVTAAAKRRGEAPIHRHVFLAHGAADQKLPIFHAQQSRETLTDLSDAS